MDFAKRGPMGQKPPKPARGTPEGLAHMMAVKSLPCVVCGCPAPSEAHHCISLRYGSRKVSDFDTIPLCYACHRGPQGIHANKAAWEARHGPDTGFLPRVAAILEGR